MIRKNLCKKINPILLVILIIAGIFTFHIIVYSAAVPGVSRESDMIKSSVAQRIKRENILEGRILDITKTPVTAAERKGENAKLLYKSLAPVIGLNDTSGSFGLRSTLEDYLYTDRDDSGSGATVTLTINVGLQESVYSLLRDRKASAVVIETRTGRILALVSSFGGVDIDLDAYHENYEEYESAGIFYPAATAEVAPPGSAFKIIPAALAVELGEQDKTFYDSGTLELPGGEMIGNYDKAALDNITLKEALINSSNTYFASFALSHRQELADISKRFLLGEEIQLDFTTLSSTSVTVDCDTGQLAMSGFGQGAVALTPLHLAMIAQTFSNGGEMYQPYLIESIEIRERTLYKGERKILSAPVGKETAGTVTEYMAEASEHYAENDALNASGFTDPGGADVISSKTGTAELPSGLNRAVYLSFNTDYTVVVTESETAKKGIDLRSDALGIYRMLKQNTTVQ